MSPGIVAGTMPAQEFASIDETGMNIQQFSGIFQQNQPFPSD